MTATSPDEPTFVDANIVLRYLMADMPSGSARVQHIVEDHPHLLITEGTIVEVSYVLQSVYRVPCEATVNALIALLPHANFQVYGIDKDVAIQALELCRPSGRVSFAEAMLWAVARFSDVAAVFTVDNRFPTAGVAVRRSYDRDRPLVITKGRPT